MLPFRAPYYNSCSCFEPMETLLEIDINRNSAYRRKAIVTLLLFRGLSINLIKI